VTEARYWFLNKPGSVVDADLPSYLVRGSWECPDIQSYGKRLAEMTLGDRVALKTVTNRTTGLPFFSRDNNVSTLTVFATGVITSVDQAAGIVSIDWTDQSAARDWYFYTNRQPIWGLERDHSGLARALLDFTFEGAEQDIATFLKDPYWGSRYTATPAFTWIPFYEEFASRLLQYRSDRGPLVALLLEASQSDPKLAYLNANGNLEDATEGTPDIDPFTVMGAFNRGVTKENRLSIAQRLGQALGVTAALPQDFDGVPVLNNMKSWFVGYAKDRGRGDVESLWRVLEAALMLADGPDDVRRDKLIADYDIARLQHGVHWNITVGLYWARPSTFATLDSRSRSFVHKRYKLSDPADGRAYLEMCEALASSFARGTSSITSFPLLSYAAWSHVDGSLEPHTVEGMAAWMAKIAATGGLVAEEHEYKRKAAQLAAEAMEQSQDSASEWPRTFKAALNATNTIDFRFKDSLNKAIAADPATAAAVLDLVWSDPVPDRLDDLHEGLRGLLGKVTPGNATALGALLLMAADTENNAPYSPSRTERWYELTQRSGPAPVGSASARYTTMLALLDELAEELAQRSEAAAPTRLETQGIAWATTESTPPVTWAEAERTALLTWRGQGAEEPRAWLARSKAAAPSWLEDGYVSLAATYLGPLDPGSSLPEVKAAIEAGYQHQDYSQRKVLEQEYYAFLSVMKPADLVATVVDGELHVGVIEGEATYVEAGGDRLRRAVSWQAVIGAEEAPPGVEVMLDRQGALVDVTEALEELQAVLDGGDGRVSDGEPSMPQSGIPALPPADGRLAAELHMPAEALQEIIGLLGSRQQIVLYGPPGTGKTFIAKAIARHVIGQDDRSRVQLVQFHPSYSYEDFFEGYRPDVTPGGEATFTLKDGPLARIAREARADGENPYVLVIDEMNRANLAKVFGELYFLLEYRRESIQLQYRPTEPFQLPPNLFIIGTMNTADRSIALLDAAMRRRFSFVELHPDESPVKDVLPAWLAANQQGPERARLLAALNAAFEDQDRDLRIGPSYLMREEASSEEGLRRVWKYDILPLLEEHYYGRLSREVVHARFGLDAVRASASGAPVAAAEEAEVDELFEDPESPAS
jgi:hypothetical protein